ncbi:hypothetical protein FOMPIDRAFT_121324 [Fomitopsis schrenkii]|uniref:Uncharacterized protein n=1 Tax=Fomitopsis schrenkii TaxID=2126942 RepID=S8FDN7_FOMSC|nr:hypothetical protein FOMPIDRAFT_121324 [Fomitopsis schrenkii]
MSPIGSLGAPAMRQHTPLSVASTPLHRCAKVWLVATLQTPTPTAAHPGIRRGVLPPVAHGAFICVLRALMTAVSLLPRVAFQLISGPRVG